MSGRLPLEGIRVTDFTWIGAGSYTTKILSDCGAEVIKIESSLRLDSLRMGAPFRDRKPGVNRSGYFADRNTSKRSVTFDMKRPRAQELVLRLIAKSDIVANNFTPGVMERIGMTYEAVRKARPDIIYLTMSMHGSSGPESRYLGYGASMVGLSGLHHLTGPADREPAGTGTNFPDHVPNPCHAAFAVLAALRHRRRTGEGQVIDIAQTEPTLALMGPTIMDLAVNGREQNRTHNEHLWAAPHGVYRCRGEDRWIAISAMSEAHWRALVEALGTPDWTTQPRFASIAARHAARHQLDALLDAATRPHDAVELMTRLQALGVPAGTVNDARDIVERDPQLKHRGHWAWLEHAEMGRSIYNNPPFRLSRSSVALRRPAPLLGEHTREVLHDSLDLSDTEIDALAAEGVLK